MTRPNVYTALEEAARVALAGEVPLALTRRDRGEWLATLPAADLVAMILQLEKLQNWVSARAEYVAQIPTVPEEPIVR